MTWQSFALGIATGGFTTTWVLSMARLLAVISAKAKRADQ